MVEENISNPVPEQKSKKARNNAILSIIFAVIALGFFPPLFGILGIILGYKAMKEGEKNLGLIGVILSAVFMVLGFIIGAGVSVLNEMNEGGASLMGIFGNFL